MARTPKINIGGRGVSFPSKKTLKKAPIGKPTGLDRKMIGQFANETARMAEKVKGITDPRMKKIAMQEIAERKNLLRQWQADIRRG